MAFLEEAAEVVVGGGLSCRHKCHARAVIQYSRMHYDSFQVLIKINEIPMLKIRNLRLRAGRMETNDQLHDRFMI